MNLTGVLTVAKGVADAVEVAKDISDAFKSEKDKDSKETNLETTTKIDNELSITQNLDEIKKEDTKNESKVETSIKNIATTLEENIQMEVDKLNLNESFWEKISKSEVMDVVKVAIEAVIKGVLKKKFNINYSTFNDMKDSLNSFMNGDLKDALKESSDAGINSIKELDGVAKTAIKTIKNSVIDKVVSSEEYELLNKQTKLLNRISSNCEKFNAAMDKNDEKTMKSRVNAIKKDMKEILPIRETISKAQGIIDKYELWQNKGKEALTKEENELIEKLNECA